MSPPSPRLDTEIADEIYRLATAIDLPDGPGAFSFNQYLIDDDEPLLFHTGPRKLFPLVRQGVEEIVPLSRLPSAPLRSGRVRRAQRLPRRGATRRAGLRRIAAMVSVSDYADRPPRALADGATLKLGRHELRWCDAPHLPHAWECGFMMETTTSTLLCGDLFTQGGKDHPALTTADILGPSEAFRAPMDYYAHAPNSRELLSRLAAFKPTTLACMHGSVSGRNVVYWESSLSSLAPLLAAIWRRSLRQHRRNSRRPLQG